MLEGAKQPLKHVSIADYLKLEICICICILSSYSVLACSIIIIIIYLFIYYYFFLGGGYAGVFRISEVLSIRVRDVSIIDFMKG